MWFTDLSLEIYVAVVTIACTAAGIWVALRLTRHTSKPKTVSLSTREQEVLDLLTQGLSNAEIADRLFLSLSTVKTHVSSLFVKMEVKNRTQAMEKANSLKILDQRNIRRS